MAACRNIRCGSFNLNFFLLFLPGTQGPVLQVNYTNGFMYVEVSIYNPKISY